jgi:aspartyl-tRNA(Asn)/glutamyl-tRNA(Gln) amidotransferase subunit A
VGYKGSQSRVPLDGVLELSRTLDTVGVIAHNVRDALAVDAVISQAPLPVAAVPLASLRLAIPHTLFLDDMEEPVAHAFERAVNALRSQGAQIESIAFDCVSQIGARSKPGGFSPVECWTAHRHRLQRSPSSVDPRVMTRVQLGQDVDAATYERFHLLRQEWIALAKQQMQGFDALICPTVPIVAPEMAPLLSDDDAFFKANRLLLRNPSMINYLNGCAWSLPIQAQGELPVGLMLSSYEHQDHHLAGVALAVEGALAATQATHQTPNFT